MPRQSCREKQIPLHDEANKFILTPKKNIAPLLQVN